MANYFAARVAPRKRFSEHLRDAGQRYEQQQQDQVDALQREETVRGIQDKRRLRDIVAATGGNWDQAAQEAAAAGLDPAMVDDLERRGADRQGRLDRREDRAYTLRERANKAGDDKLTRALKNFDVQAKIGEATETITDDASYQAWREAAGQAAQAAGLRFQAPDTYDPAYIDTIRTRAAKSRQAWTVLSESQKETLGLPADGAYQQKRDGEVKQVTAPRSHQRSTLREVYDETSPTGSRWLPDDQAAGKPGKRTGGGGSDVAQSRALIIRKDYPGMSMTEAMDRARQSVQDPVGFARDMVKMEIGTQNMGGQDPAVLEERMRYWVGKATEMRGSGTPRPEAPPPIPGARQAKDGNWYVKQNGKWMRVDN